jgi:hypothetical protein
VQDSNRHVTRTTGAADSEQAHDKPEFEPVAGMVGHALAKGEVGRGDAAAAASAVAAAVAAVSAQPGRTVARRSPADRRSAH